MRTSTHTNSIEIAVNSAWCAPAQLDSNLRSPHGRGFDAFVAERQRRGLRECRAFMIHRVDARERSPWSTREGIDVRKVLRSSSDGRVLDEGISPDDGNATAFELESIA